jgi:hypothetical protein
MCVFQAIDNDETRIKAVVAAVELCFHRLGFSRMLHVYILIFVFYDLTGH